MKSRIWTMDEVQALTSEGWFYGFVRWKNKIIFGEIFPGMGVAETIPEPWWNPKSWWWAARDVICARKRYLNL